jgi:hypothetical protein
MDRLGGFFLPREPITARPYRAGRQADHPVVGDIADVNAPTTRTFITAVIQTELFYTDAGKALAQGQERDRKPPHLRPRRSRSCVCASPPTAARLGGYFWAPFRVSYSTRNAPLAASSESACPWLFRRVRWNATTQNHWPSACWKMRPTSRLPSNTLKSSSDHEPRLRDTLARRRMRVFQPGLRLLAPFEFGSDCFGI